MTIDSGWWLTAGGFALSLWAVITAESAKKAVKKVIEKSGEQVVRDDARDLLTKLNAAREVALARRGDTRRTAIAGRSVVNDLAILKQAQDALAITTLSTDVPLERGLRLASMQIDDAVKVIENKTGRDGWGDALIVLQGVIPKVNTHQRKLGTKALT